MFALLDKRDIADPDRGGVGAADRGPLGAGDRRGANLQGDRDHLRQSGIGSADPLGVARYEADIVHPVGHHLCRAATPGAALPLIAALPKATAGGPGSDGSGACVVADPDALSAGEIVHGGEATVLSGSGNAAAGAGWDAADGAAKIHCQHTAPGTRPDRPVT